MRLGLDISINSTGVGLITPDYKELIDYTLITGNSKQTLTTRMYNLRYRLITFLYKYGPLITNVNIEQNINVRNNKICSNLSKMVGIATSVLFLYELEFNDKNFIYPSEWKKQVCNNGKITKKQTIEFVKDRFNIKEEDIKNINDDIADSLCIAAHKVK
jgi:Holliday junction resolvasome RuvABC endonuclease subunit